MIAKEFYLLPGLSQLVPGEKTSKFIGLDSFDNLVVIEGVLLQPEVEIPAPDDVVVIQDVCCHLLLN